MKSPFTGKEMKLVSEKRTVSFRKQEIEYTNISYYCDDSKEYFVTTKLDEINIKQIHNKYRELNHIPFPEEIRNLRSKYKISATKMSELFGFGPNQYSLYENGEIPNLSNAKAIRLALNPIIFKTILESNVEVFKHSEYQILVDIVENIINIDTWDYIHNYLLGNEHPDSLSGYKIPNYKKLYNMVGYFAEKIHPQKTFLNKLLFYCDFGHYKNYSESISGCRYAAIPNGPVPNNYNSLFERMEKENIVILNEIFYGNGIVGEQFIPHPKFHFNADIFSKTELEIINKVCLYFTHKTTKEIISISHDEKAWKENEKAKKLIDYSYSFELNLF